MEVLLRERRGLGFCIIWGSLQRRHVGWSIGIGAQRVGDRLDELDLGFLYGHLGLIVLAVVDLAICCCAKKMKAHEVKFGFESPIGTYALAWVSKRFSVGSILLSNLRPYSFFQTPHDMRCRRRQIMLIPQQLIA